MDLLSGYESDPEPAGPARPTPADIAPAVDTTGLTLVSAGGPAGAGAVVPLGATKALHDPGKHVVFHNPRVQDLFAPAAGPAHPYRAHGVSAGERNHPTGNVEVSTAFLRDRPTSAHVCL